METNIYKNNDVCIVGIGCVLPDADNVVDFWNNIKEGRRSISEMPESRFKKKLYFSENKKEKDRAYSNRAAFIKDEQIDKICKNLNLNRSEYTKMQILSLGAANQAISCLKDDSKKKFKNKTDIFLGCMEIDDSFVLEKIWLKHGKEIERYIKNSKVKDPVKIFDLIKKHFNHGEKIDKKTIISSVLANSTINLIKERFNIKGEGALVDAACASSMAALDVSVNSLRDYKSDLVISGGIEANLGPDTFVLFSRVGALSIDGCLPFDKKTDGLSQGEGSAIFVLQRMEDAIKDGNTIYGVIRQIGGSSDGKSASLFSPSSAGQTLAYKRAYDGLDKTSVDYIECHGTGTKLGDATELKSLNTFFATGKIPVGSVKSLIGHTKGAAGAVGILKCILMMKNKVIAPSNYLKFPIAPDDGVVFLNPNPVNFKSTEPIRCGISSFGFGNINFHVVLDEFDKKTKLSDLQKSETLPIKEIAIIGQASMDIKDVDFKVLSKKFKIPPQSIPHIDTAQLLGLVVAGRAIEESCIDIDLLDKENVGVVSASSIGLDAALDFVNRVRCFELENALEFADKKSIKTVLGFKNRFPEASEDTGHGVLNNVIAGRVCNAFDFKGKNFNVDSDFNSFPAALNIVTRELNKQEGIIILIYVDEKLNEVDGCVERDKVSCLLLSTVSFAKKMDLPIREVIKTISYHE